MGAYSRRRLRAAIYFVARPLLAAILVTMLCRLLFSSKAPKSASKSSAPPPAAHKPSKALVVATTSDLSADETSWISEVPHDWLVYKYVADAPTSAALSVPVNKGNEAMVYLTYIIDHYATLPDIVFFHHGHKQAWHQSEDSLWEVTHLRTSHVLSAGYASARCLPGCENVIETADYSVDPAQLRRAGRDVQLATLLDEFVDRERGEGVPVTVAAPCCAQFAASRAAIRRRSREWWTRLRQFLIDTPMDNRSSGRIMEHTWHIWLGKEAKLCPDFEACRCHVFGVGDCQRYFDQERES